MKEKILGNRYKIVEKIGKGGMALVYKAYDTRLTREVAIKVLRHELVEDSEFKKRFLREAQSAAKLSHQNIVSVFDVDEFENINYIVMEYVDGKSLKDLLRENGVMPFQMAINTTIKICDAIQCAHEVGIIHRDIKPQNIMIKKDGSIKVTDFGIAKYIAATTITQDGNLMGSVHYLSPERILGLKPDNRADIYSIGITFYEMLVGTVPFNGENPVAVMSQHVKEKPNVDILAKYVPSALLNIVLKTLNKEAKDRYQSANELKYDLIKLLSSNELNIKDESNINKKYEEEIKKNLSKMMEKESESLETNKKNNNEIDNGSKMENADEYTKTVAYIRVPGNTETFIDIKALKKDIDGEEAKKDNVEFIKLESSSVDEDNNKDENEMNTTSKTKMFNTIKTIEVGKFINNLSKDKEENNEEEIFDTIQAPFIEKIDNKSRKDKEVKIKKEELKDTDYKDIERNQKNIINLNKEKNEQIKEEQIREGAGIKDNDFDNLSETRSINIDKRISKNDSKPEIEKLENKKELNNIVVSENQNKVDDFAKKQEKVDSLKSNNAYLVAENNSTNNSKSNEYKQNVNNKDNSNRKFIIIISVISLLIIVGIIVIVTLLIDIFKSDNENVTPDNSINFINYENKEYGIGFSYPENWNKTENESNYLVIINSPSENDIKESISIGVKDIIFDIPIDYATNEIVGNLLQKLIGEEIDSNSLEDDEIANHDAKKMETNKNNLNNILWLIQDDAKIYYIDYSVSSEKTTENMDKIVESIEISN
jgi:serine/threonine-protein kinase